MNESNLIVVGGGAAGLMCACIAAERGLSVTIFEPNRTLGRKLRITGKGRCNVTNNCSIKDFMNAVPGDGRFLYSALNRFSPADVMSFFENGVPLKTERGNRVFPVSDNANDIADYLADRCRRTGVKVVRERVSKLIIEDNVVKGVNTSSGAVHYSENVCVCTGGLSYPLTGSDGDGYRFAQTAGHSVTKLRPSLVPLESDAEYCSQMQGFAPRNVTLTLYEDNVKIFSDFGEMLFTHFGVSGPLVLSASAHIRNMGRCSYRFELDLKPALDEIALDKRILRDFEKYSNREFKNALSDLSISSMIPILIELSQIPPEQKVNSITREQRQKLVHLFKAFPIPISGFRSIDEAIITSGGVALKEINPRTMESKLVSGLYFAGEVLDLDAYTGGFNLQIAWSTGYVAGCSVPVNE